MKNTGCIWKILGFGVIAFLIIGIIAFFQQEEEPAVEKPVVEESKPISQNFIYAVKSEVWVIEEDNIPLMDVPQSFSDHDQFNAHLNCILKSGQKVEVIRTKLVGSWKYLRVIGSICTGWVSGYTVKKARLTSRW